MCTVIVCGGRAFYDRRLLFGALDDLHTHRHIDRVIHGGASGADTLAGTWAAHRNVAVQEFPAKWQTHGRRAGPLRNQQMLDQQPDLVVAFPGGAGTYDMVRRATEAGVEVAEITDSNQRFPWGRE